MNASSWTCDRFCKEGGEPFNRIMSTLDDVPEGYVLHLRAAFKPMPLFGVMRARGWKHWIERGAGDDWIIWFYRTRDFNWAHPCHERRLLRHSVTR